MPADDRWIPSTCSQCYSCCAIKAHVVDGVLVKIEGNPDSATNRGRLCPRGVSGIMLLYDPARVNVPLKRTNPEKGIGIDPGWVEISWDEALNTVAERLRALRQDDPRKLLFSYTVSGGDELGLGRLFSLAYGSPNSWASGAGNHCGNAEHLLGAVFHAAWAKQPDTTYCTYLLNFGCSVGFGAYYCVNGMAQRIAEARVRGMRHVVIDPFLSPTAEKADEWIPIRPGTDGAFALAMLNLLLNDYHLYDEPYLRDQTNGPYLIGPDGQYVRDPATQKPLIFDTADGVAKPFDAADLKESALEGQLAVQGVTARPAFCLLRDEMRQYTPEWAEQITSVPAATIRRITREFGEAARIGSTIVVDGKTLPYRPVALMYFKGAHGHRGALPTSLALDLLIQVVGASDVPGGVLGTNACSLGHPESGRPSWIPSIDEDGLMVTGTWLAPPAPYPLREVRVGEAADLTSLLPTSIGSSGLLPLAMDDPGKFGVPYRIELNLHVGTNYLMTTANPGQIAAAFKGVFQVSFSLFLDESTELSDIVLPAASYLERLSQIPDHLHSNAPVGEWSYHVRQPVVPPIAQRRMFAEVLLDLVERLDMREEFFMIINGAWGLEEPYALDPSRRYAWLEIVDRHYRSRFGDAHGIDWFKEHGVLKWAKRAEEVYWMAFTKARLPVYVEWLPLVGRQIDEATRHLPQKLDTSAFAALPAWRPCAAHAGPKDGADLVAIYYKVPMQTFSGTYNNPWLAEMSAIHPFANRVAINTETARRKGIADGDWVRIASAATGESLRIRAAVTQGIHPEVVAIAGCGGHWSRSLPVASQPERGACFERLLPLTLEDADLPSQSIDTCVRVNVERCAMTVNRL